MLRIVTINWRNYQGRGVEYVNILHDSVLRNLPEGFPGTFEVFTDDVSESGYSAGITVRPMPEPSLDGWWHKLSLFKEGVFPEGNRILYFDLDTVITGRLDEIVACDEPFAMLRDAYRPNGLQSSVMLWMPSSVTEWVWRFWDYDEKTKYAGGDQEVIERSDFQGGILQHLFPSKFASFKAEASMGIPKGCSVVFFHGEPRPHQVTDGWVPNVWKMGGGTSAELFLVPNVPLETISANIKAAMKRDAPWLEMHEPHERPVCIVAGGPSLLDESDSLGAHIGAGHTVMAVNNAWRSVPGLPKNFIHVICDARAENLDFVPRYPGLGEARLYYCSQCDPVVLDAAKDRLTLWHPYFDGIKEVVGLWDGPLIGGGSTAGLKAICLALALGYRKIHLYGFDSSYRDGDGHAYPQAMNDGERIIDATAGNRTYKAAPWMVTQADEFRDLAPELLALGVELYVHGDGLLPHMAHLLKEQPTPAAEVRANEIAKRLPLGPLRGVEVGIFVADMSRRLLAKARELELILVDSWSGSHAPSYVESGDWHVRYTQAEQDRFYDVAQAAVSTFGHRAQFLRMTSLEAAHRLKGETLDFVFIDADHSYVGCKEDILAWAPRVRLFLSGHDYDNQEFPGFGVKRAVDEFIETSGWRLELGENYTWFAYPKETT